MKIEHVSRLEIEDDTFTYEGGDGHRYEDIASIAFSAVATKHSVNFIPTGTSYEANLTIQLTDGYEIRVKPDWGLFQSGTQKERVEALWRAKEYLSELSFTARIERCERQVAERGYFNYADYQFHRDGDVFRRGRRLLNLKDKSVAVSLGPFQLHFVREKTAVQKLGSLFVNLDEIIDVSADRDCVLYMMKHLYGFVWTNERVREKRIDPRRLFMVAILMLRKPGGYRTTSMMQKALSMLQRDEMDAWMRPVWSDIRGASLRDGHPAPYPVELAERIIRMFSFAGDVVLDPFAGSASTAVAALRAGRSSVSVEVEPAYVAMAAARLAAEIRKPVAFGPRWRELIVHPLDAKSAARPRANGSVSTVANI